MYTTQNERFGALNFELMVTHMERLQCVPCFILLHCANFLFTKTPTNPDQTKQWDNLVFESQASAEFTGRSGILNLMRQYNLSLQEALEVSDHLPVWAEFSIYEGGTVPEDKIPAEEVQARKQGAPAR